MSIVESLHRLVPIHFRNSESPETLRRATLIVYATAFAVLTPLPIAIILQAIGSTGLAFQVLAGMLPSAATLLILHMSRSTNLAGHYLTGWVFLQTMLDFGHDSGFSLLAIFAIPILACAMINEKAAIGWTLGSIGWVISIAIQVSPSDPLYFGLVWSSAVVVGVIGFALVVLESSRTKARIESEEANKELFTQRERLRAFAENAFPAIAESINAEMLYVSDGVGAALGYTPEEFQQRTLDTYVHPSDLPDILRQLERVNVSGMHCETRMRHKMGFWVWMEAFAIPHGPGRNRWIFAARNIDAEKSQREVVQQAQRLESVGLIAAGVAHDFNNLLTVTMGFAEILPASESKEEIIRATTESAKLTQQLMSFARNDGEGPFTTNAVQILKDLQPMLANLFGPKVELNMALPMEPQFVSVSAGQLHQVIINLATNAKRAITDGGIFSIELTELNEIASSTNENSVEILVSDTGQGMDDFTRQHAFDPFYTTKDNSRGAGLGLASVYGIMSNAGGRVTLNSTLGMGTQIRLIIPKSNPTHGTPQVTIDDLTDRQEANSQMLLVVEDNISIRSLMVHTLERGGYNIETANTLDAVRELAQTIEPDLLILDRTANVGGNVLQDLMGQFPRLKVLLTGGRAEPELHNSDDQMRTRFLAKPYRSSDLIRSVHTLLASPVDETSHH